MYSFDDVVPVAAGLGQCHFVGIGGVGMSAVAKVMAGRDMVVTGSDAKDVPALASLRALGVDARVGFHTEMVEAADTIVVGSAIPADNTEVVHAKSLGKRIIHRSQALAAVMAGHTGIAVAGTNGKTTTSSMVAFVLDHAGRHPSYAIGGELVSSATNGLHASGDEFVAEACESDRSFVVYEPQVAIVTNVQPDHLDFYGTFDAVQAAFDDFAARVGADGTLVVCADDEGAAALAASRRAVGATVWTYGVASDADFRITDIEHNGPQAHARIHTPSGESYQMTLVVPGFHNIVNATAAFAACRAVGMSAEDALAGLAAFTGARRRFELVGRPRDVVVYDDYAHNPPKVAAALATGRSVAGDGALHVVFQPHLYSRTRDFAEEFGEALTAADGVFVMDVYPARELPIPGVSGRLIADAAAKRGANVTYSDRPEDVAGWVAARARSGDAVLLVGAGDITALRDDVVAAVGESA